MKLPTNKVTLNIGTALVTLSRSDDQVMFKVESGIGNKSIVVLNQDNWVRFRDTIANYMSAEDEERFCMQAQEDLRRGEQLLREEL